MGNRKLNEIRKCNKRKREDKFQENLVYKLREGAGEAYRDATLYTILYDLSSGNGINEIFMVLHNLSSDLDERAELEDMFDKAKKWDWD